MKRVQENGTWTLMCPHSCPGLSDVYGDDFDEKYTNYEKMGLGKEVSAQELWFKILESQTETGTPYILFKDSCNKKSNQKNLGVIKSSNLCCVTPDTKILTKNGYYTIKELETKDVHVWNGKQWSKTCVMKTGHNKKVLDVHFSNGMHMKCTEYHKFYIETSSRPAVKSKPIIVEAKDLTPKMRIIRYTVEMGEQSTKEMKYAYTCGMFSADGTYSVLKTSTKRCSFKSIKGEKFCKRHMNNNSQKYFDTSDTCKADSYEKRGVLYLYGEKKKLLEHISYSRMTESSTRLNLEMPHDIEDKYTVPINYCLDTKLRWLEGLFDGDGCVIKNNDIKNVQLSSVHKEFLENVFFLLQTIGIMSTISLSQKKHTKEMPNGKNGTCSYMCKDVYRMNIDCENVIKMKNLGFSPKRLDIDNVRLPHHKTNKYITVVNVVDNNEYSDTYCFNEPQEHKGIFNGILTGQCEIVEHTSKDETAVCNLASISLTSCVIKPNVPHKIIITSIPNCVYCLLAKSWCERWDLEYEYVELCAPESGKKYPQIKVGDFCGGFNSFVETYPVNYDYEELQNIARQLTRNLNRVIDKSTYPIESARRSNTRHRPIGIGVQGLADVFMKMRIGFDSTRAKFINEKIFETIYYAAEYMNQCVWPRKKQKRRK